MNTDLLLNEDNELRKVKRITLSWCFSLILSFLVFTIAFIRFGDFFKYSISILFLYLIFVLYISLKIIRLYKKYFQSKNISAYISDKNFKLFFRSFVVTSIIFVVALYLDFFIRSYILLFFLMCAIALNLTTFLILRKVKLRN